MRTADVGVLQDIDGGESYRGRSLAVSEDPGVRLGRKSSISRSFPQGFERVDIEERRRPWGLLSEPEYTRPPLVCDERLGRLYAPVIFASRFCTPTLSTLPRPGRRPCVWPQQLLLRSKPCIGGIPQRLRIWAVMSPPCTASRYSAIVSLSRQKPPPPLTDREA